MYAAQILKEKDICVAVCAEYLKFPHWQDICGQ